ncbi:MAG: DinB family protein [Bacteroidota bacterium]
MNWTFDIALKNRAFLKSIIENHSLEDLNKIPKGFNNNIIWNIAHTITVQQSLVYKLSGLPPMVSEDLIMKFRRGSKPEGDMSQAEVDEIKGLLFSTIEKTKEDYDNKIFRHFHEYTVMTKNTITNILEAIEFNNYHEGIHLGYILALKHAL